MDERVEAFLADVLALAGEEANAIRQGARGTLADLHKGAEPGNRLSHD
jgi:hypothetical protein